jgi:Ca2+-binding RTX toxin-like protein/predicted nuclease of predicted toxin-antitoxin system
VSDSALALTIQSPTTSLLEGQPTPFKAILPSGSILSSYQWSAVDIRGQTVSQQAGVGPDVENFDFIPPRGGEFLVVLEAIFSDGTIAKAISEELSATGLAPTIVNLAIVNPPGNVVVTEGMEVTVRASATDPGERVGLTYRWELMRPGGGWTEVEGLARRPSDMRFVPSNNGLHRIRVTVSDSQGLSATQELVRFSTTGIEVDNLAPDVRLLAVGNTETQVTFRAQATDPGSDDQPGLTYAWSVNGGTFSDPSASDTFSVALSGLHTLRVRVSDDTTFTEVSSYILRGTQENDSITLTSTDANNAVTAGAQQIVYLALDGNDEITVAAGISLPVLIFGGAGNDTLNASAATGPVLLDGGDGDDVLRGGAGNDLLIAGAGTNELYGGDGNNRFIGGGNDTMVGGIHDDYYEVHFSTVVIQDTGGGFNTIDLNAAPEGVTLDFGLTNGTAQTVFEGSTLSLDGNFQRLVGSSYGDQFQSDIPGTELFGGAGSDQLIANGTGIVLDGGDGDDEFILSNASATIIGGSGNNTVLGTLAVGSESDIDLGNGDGTVDIVGATPIDGEPLAKVTIVGGLGANTISASGVQGTIYAYTGGDAGAISEFGTAAAPSASLISISNSSDIDIFGSALPGNQLVVTNSQDISIFGGGGDQAVLTDVTRATIDGSLFGSAAGPQVMTATITSSSDIDIFGSAQPNVTLTSAITNSSDIDIFGSAREANQILVLASSDISIFGMAEGSIDLSGDGSGSLVERTSLAISDFGSATPKSLSITLDQSQDIDIFGSVSPTGTPISAIINASSDISIFGSAAQQASIIVTASQDIDIFGLVDGYVQLGPDRARDLRRRGDTCPHRC